MSDPHPSSLDALPLDILQRVHAACEGFEQSCQSGHVPRLNKWLEQVPAKGREEAFLELLGLEVEYRRTAGETVTLADCLERYPDQAELVRRFWQDPEVARDLPPPPQLGDFRMIREIGRGGMAVVYLAEQISLSRPVAIKILSQATVLDPARRERFQREARSAASLQHPNIVPVFGVGCDHDVYYYVMLYIDGDSLDKIIGRLRQAPASGSGMRALLPLPEPGQPEAQLSPDDNGSPGSSSAIHPLTNGDSTDRAYFKHVARIIQQAAHGLHHAHQEGILHRDVKPSNLLLDKSGKLWIADFGLAKSMSDTERLTQPGDVAGTLQYMAPETFQGDVDVRSDLYGLGLTLYELLTLQPPYDVADRGRLVNQVLHRDPTPPRRCNPRIPRDLETICLKCIQKEPASRYATAGDLADDLQRFLEGKSIHARPVSGLTRLALWARRRPAIAGLLALVLLMTIGALAGLTWGVVATTRWANEAAALADANRQKLVIEQQRAASESRRAAAEAAQSEAERLRAVEAQTAQQREQELRRNVESSLVSSRVALAERSWLAGDVGAARLALDRCLPRPGEPDLRRWEWHYVHQLCHAELAVWQHEYWVNDVAFSPDGQLLAVAAGSPGSGVGDAMQHSELQIYRVDTQERIATLLEADEPGPAVRKVQFSANGNWLVANDVGGRWHTWNTKNWKRRISIPGLGATCLADEPTLAVIGSRGELSHVNLLDTDGEPRPVRPPISMSESPLAAAFSPDGRFAIIRDHSSPTLHVVDVTTGQDVAAPETKPSSAPVAVGPGGRYLVSGEHLWDAASGEDIAPLATQSIFSPTFSRDGKWLIWTAWPRNSPSLARLDSTPFSPHSLQRHSGEVNCIRFGPRSEYLATGSADGTAAWWALNSRSIQNVFRHGSDVRAVAISPDRKFIASAGQDGTVRLWSTTRDPRGRLLRLHHHFGENISAFVFSSDSQELLVAEHHSQFAFNIADGKPTPGARHDIRASFFVPRSVTAFARDGSRLISAAQSDYTIVKIWKGAGTPLPPPAELPIEPTKDESVQSPRLLHVLRGHSKTVQCVASDASGNRFASLAFPQSMTELAELIVWNGDGKLASMHTTLPASCLALSNDGSQLAAAGADGIIRLWNLDTEAPPQEFSLPETLVFFLRFSNDGQRLAAGTPSGVPVWEVRSGSKVMLDASSHAVTGIDFNPDDSRIATVGVDEGVVHLWDTASGEHVYSLRSLSSARPAAYTFMARVHFSPCGRHLAANNWDASFNVWSLVPPDNGGHE